jgi:hypothetical protein
MIFAAARQRNAFRYGFEFIDVFIVLFTKLCVYAKKGRMSPTFLLRTFSKFPIPLRISDHPTRSNRVFTKIVLPL